MKSFSKEKVGTLPQEMEVIVGTLKQCHSKEECLRKVYDILTEKYRGYRIKTYFRLFDLFVSDLEKLWSKKGFMHCTTLNRLMKLLLVSSGLFKKGDIQSKWTLVWYVSPHQYLLVKTEDEHMHIDLWGNAYGIKFGDYAHGFHSST